MPRRRASITAGDHSAPSARIAADDDGLTSQLGMVPLLRGHEEGIHVYMEALAKTSAAR